MIDSFDVLKQMSSAEVVAAVVAALEQRRWRDVLPFVDHEDLDRFRREQLAALRQMIERAPRTPDDIAREQPGISPELAEMQARSEADWVARSRPSLLQGWGVRATSELETLSPEELFIRSLDVAHGGSELRGAPRAIPVDNSDAALPGAAQPRAFRRLVIGEVREGESLAHVVYREAFVFPGQGGGNGEGEGHIHVVSLRRTASGWRIPLGARLLTAHPPHV